MRKIHCRNWKMLRNTEIVQNEEHTLQDLGYGKKTDKRGKCDTQTVGPGKWQETVKNMKNEKCTPQDLDYGEKTEKRGKLDQHIV